MTNPPPARYGEVTWLLALLRDVALIVFVIVYVVHTL